MQMDARPLPDLGPKTVSKLLQDRLSGIILKDREVPVQWESPTAVERKEVYPCIYIEFVDLERADDRQFSGTINCAINELTDGTHSDSVVLHQPDAYMASFNVHLYAEGVDDIMALVTEVNRRIPSFGYQFELNEGQYRLAIQRPERGVNADIVEEMFFHRIYTYEIESYLFDFDSVSTVPNLEKSKFSVTVKDS